MASRLRPSGGCRGQPSGADVSHASLAAAIVADMLAATGREKMPMARSAAPKIWVAAAERVQRAGGPGRKLKNLATTFAEKPSTFCASDGCGRAHQKIWCSSCASESHLDLIEAVVDHERAGAKAHRRDPGIGCKLLEAKARLFRLGQHTAGRDHAADLCGK